MGHKGQRDFRRVSIKTMKRIMAVLQLFNMNMGFKKKDTGNESQGSKRLWTRLHQDNEMNIGSSSSAL